MENRLKFVLMDYQDSRWMAFIGMHPESHVFHHPAWIGTIAKSYGYSPFVAAVLNDQGKITAGMPVMEISNRLNNHRWVSLPFTDHCAPLYQDLQGLRALEDGVIEEGKKQKVVDLQLRWNYQSSKLFHSCDHVLSILKLASEACDVAKGIKGNDLRKLKIAAREGVLVERGTSLRQLEIFYKLHVETRRRHGMPVQPWHYFQILREELLEKGMGFISLAHIKEDYLAGVIYLRWKNTLVYKYAASNQSGRQLSAGDPLVWDAICWGCENNITTIDFGRSDNSAEGLRRYKKRWGSDESPLIYSQNLQPATNSLEQKMMPMLNSVIKKSPMWVCRISGEMLYRYFG